MVGVEVVDSIAGSIVVADHRLVVACSCSCSCCSIANIMASSIGKGTCIVAVDNKQRVSAVAVVEPIVDIKKDYIIISINLNTLHILHAVRIGIVVHYWN